MEIVLLDDILLAVRDISYENLLLAVYSGVKAITVNPNSKCLKWTLNDLVCSISLGRKQKMDF